MGYCSRSQAEKLIAAGKVTVGGKKIIDPSFRLTPEREKILVEGNAVARKKYYYIVLNKPAGYVTTRDDERGRKTVYDLLTGIDEWVFPVGRLDKDTSGLLIFTNDTKFGEQLTSPDSKVQKVYRVTLDKPFLPAHKELLEQGMELDGENLLPAAIKIVDGGKNPVIEMTIIEGKNRQVRRMCESLGYAVLSLQRITIGGYRLGNLKEGTWKYMTNEEVEMLAGKK